MRFAFVLFLLLAACQNRIDAAGYIHPDRPLIIPDGMFVEVVMLDPALLKLSGQQFTEFENLLGYTTCPAANRCIIVVPRPTGPRDIEAWTIWYHELRHVAEDRLPFHRWH